MERLRSNKAADCGRARWAFSAAATDGRKCRLICTCGGWPSGLARAGSASRR